MAFLFIPFFCPWKYIFYVSNCQGTYLAPKTLMSCKRLKSIFIILLKNRSPPSRNLSKMETFNNSLKTLSWHRFLSYRNQSIDLLWYIAYPYYMAQTIFIFAFIFIFVYFFFVSIIEKSFSLFSLFNPILYELLEDLWWSLFAKIL